MPLTLCRLPLSLQDGLGSHIFEANVVASEGMLKFTELVTKYR